MKKKNKQKKQEKIAAGAKSAFRFTGELLAAVLTVVFILATLLAVVYRDRLNLDAVKRLMTYSSISTGDDHQTEEFLFSTDSSNSYAALNGGLLLCSRHSLQFYSSGGTQVLSREVSMEHPVISVNGSYAAAYDAGGRDLFIFRGSEIVFEYTAKEESSILSARINEEGFLVIVEQTAGHKATVTVYGNRFEPRIAVNESTNFVSDAIVSDDCKTVALLEISQKESEFSSALVFYRLSDAMKIASAELGSELAVDLKWSDERLWVQTESGVTVLDDDGEIIDGWTVKNKYLERYTLDGTGYAVELDSKYRSGSAGELHVIGEDGQQKVSRSIGEEVLSVSAAGKYIAVLTTARLIVYTSDLQEYAAAANTTARRAIMRSDGSALLVGKENARLFIP